MSKKRFNRKLALNKKTVANLNNFTMGRVLGGALTDETCTCPQSCEIVCLPTTQVHNTCPPTAWRCTYDAECQPQP